MRIHFGVSKFISPAKLIKWLGLAFLGLMAFFGIDKYFAHAATLSTQASDWTYNYWAGSDYDDSTSDIVATASPANYFRPNDAWFGYIQDIGRYSQRGQYVTGNKGYMCSSGEKVTATFRIGLTSLGFTNYPPVRVTMNNGGNTTNCTYTVSNDGYYLDTSCESVVRSTTSLIGIGLEVNGSGFTMNSKGFFIIPNSIDYTCTDASNSDAIMDNANQNAQDIMDNANQNAQDIMDNQNENTEAIIQNQIEQSEKEIESQKVCKSVLIDKYFEHVNGYLDGSGFLSGTNSSSYVTTNFLKIDSNSRITLLTTYSNSDYRRACFYDSNKIFISCIIAKDYSNNSIIPIPNNSYYVRFTVRSSDNAPTYDLLSCKNGNQAISDSLTDDNVSGANQTGNDLFDTELNNHGITSIVTAPVRLLQAILNSNQSCTNLPLTINMGSAELTKNVSIPSGCILWDNVPSAVKVVYWTTIFGLLIYYVLIDLFHFIDDLHDPDKKNSYTLDL